MIVLIRKEDPAASMLNTPLPPSTSQPPQCRLLALPAELRNHIWSYLLIQDTEALILKTPTTSKQPFNPTVGQTPRRTSGQRLITSTNTNISATILQTCRQIHAEGTSILYGANVFDAHSSLLSSLPSLNLSTHPARIVARPVIHSSVARLIRRFFLHVRLDTDPRFSRAQVADAFTGVAELEIEVFQSSYGTCDFTVLALFEGVRDVGYAVVGGSVGDGKYAAHLARMMESPVGTEWLPYHERFVGGDRAWDAWTNGNR